MSALSEEADPAHQLDPERKHGFSAEPVPVSAYVGSSKNLKDLKAGRANKGVLRLFSLHALQHG